MTYKEAKDIIPPNRRWCKWINYLYLQRYRGTIRIRYGFRYSYSQVIGVWCPDGKFKFPAVYYYPSQVWRLNHFMPEDYKVCTHRYYSFLFRFEHNDSEPRAFYIRNGDHNRYLDSVQNRKNPWVVITQKGVQTKLGPTLQKVQADLKQDDYNRDKPRRRGRYWVRKARGVFHKPCGKQYNGCEWLQSWPKPTTEWVGECGCRVFTKKSVSRDTVASILEERNATVRAAKIQIYGIEKFFTDAEAKIIDQESGYQLLQLNTGVAIRDPDRADGRPQMASLVLTALRMECSTTGKVYVNTVPPQFGTVRRALDWMYDIPHYLKRVGKQT